ncbi:MAG TPA: MOSC N-terminal beta barrel domain-containing protein [Candidatus Dormibacteraeota bacterium]|nr:MOSC N-terminal beta barrel domain-containing protein [Candidatus Dormibacteraeota bacterium]
MAVVGRVAGLNRYPVKSMQGESLSDAEVGELGIPNDRIYGVRDVATTKVLSAKREPRLLLAAAATNNGEVSVTVPGQAPMSAEDPRVSVALSEWLGREVRLERATPTTEAFYEFQTEGDPAADVIDLPVLDGSFFDLAPLHLLTQASLASAARLDPGLDWDIRRFRPTVLVEAASDGDYPEDAWVGHELDIGGVRADVIMPTIRCAMPMAAQPGLSAQPALMPRLKQGHNALLGVYATVLAPGHLAVGDELSL